MRIIPLILLAAFGCTSTAQAEPKPHVYKVQKTKAEWKKQLTKEQFHVLREAGTERSFSGKYWGHKLSLIHI